MADTPSAVVDIIVHDGTISVIPTVVRAEKGEVVKWQAPGASSFVLVFRDGAAIAVPGYGRGVEVMSVIGEVTVEPWVAELLKPEKVVGPGPIALATISDSPGVHQYQLAVLKAERDEAGKVSEKLYLDVGCPEVIIK